jgi:hypothetical protein
VEGVWFTVVCEVKRIFKTKPMAIRRYMIRREGVKDNQNKNGREKMEDDVGVGSRCRCKCR